MSFIEKIKEKEGLTFAKQMIQEYMKKNKLTLEEFVKINPNYTTFAQNTRGKEFDYAKIIKNHGINLDEKLYQEIIQDIKEEEKKKKALDVNVDTSVVNGHEITTVTDKKTGNQKIFDNTVSNRTIKSQMESIQSEHNQFQNIKGNNTLNIMKYMENNIKITPRTEKVNNFNSNTLNTEEKKVLKAARLFENAIGHPINIDLNQKLVFDKNKIYSLDKHNGIYNFIASQKTNSKGKVNTLIKSYSMNRKRENNE